MRPNHLARLFPLVLATACAAPGTELHPMPEDFAFLEVQLLG